MSAITFEFSEEYLQNLKEGLSQLEKDFWSGNTYQEFLDNPYSFLTKMRIRIVENIGKNPELVQQFNNSIKSLLPTWRIALRDLRCVMCKISALTILYSLLGVVGMAWDAAIAFIDNTVVSAIDKAIGGTGEKANAFITKLRKLTDRLTIHELALELCRFHGYCKLQEY